MTFLNATLLAGAAAGGIPIAIHLLQRKRRKVVLWGAMQLLTAQTHRRSRTLQLDHLLLLLLRTAIPVVLALCMAKPLLSGLSSGGNSSPASVVILLDDSASMGDGAPSSPLGQVKAAAKSLLEALPRGSEVTVIPITDPDAPIIALTTDLPSAAQKITLRAAQPAAARITDSLDAAATLLSRSHHARRHLAILSDFQASNWPDAAAEARLQTLQRIQSQTIQPSVSILQASATTTPNTAVESLDFSRLPVGPNQKLKFVATLRNYDTNARNGVQVVWKVDGHTVTSARVDIPQSQSTQVALERSFTEPGTHTVQISADHDSLPFDDAFTSIVTVHQPIPVLLVNGRPSQEALQGETDFLEIALQSRTSSLSDSASFFQTSVVEPATVGAQLLKKTQIVVLADVHTLSAQQVRDLEDFVRAGGGLVYLPGRQTDQPWTNKALHNNGKGLLPAPLAAFSTEQSAGKRLPPTVAKPYPRHPILEPFQQSESAFDELRIKAWFSIHPGSPVGEIGESSAAGAILSFDSGEALFLEHKYGAGTVIQSAIPCSADWSNLPTRPAFVPLVQRMVSYCALGSNPDPVVEAGRPLLFQLPPNEAGKSLTVITPLGRSTQAHLQLKGAKAVGEFTSTHTPGIYQVVSPEGDAKSYAVNPSREESDLHLLATDAVVSFAKTCGASVSKSPDELASSIQGSEHGREIWRPLVWATLLLLLAEMLLSQRFSRLENSAK